MHTTWSKRPSSLDNQLRKPISSPHTYIVLVAVKKLIREHSLVRGVNNMYRCQFITQQDEIVAPNHAPVCGLQNTIKSFYCKQYLWFIILNYNQFFTSHKRAYSGIMKTAASYDLMLTKLRTESKT